MLICHIDLEFVLLGVTLQILTGHTDMLTSITMGSMWTDIQPQQNHGDTTDTVIVSVADDKTSKVFHVNMSTLSPPLTSTAQSHTISS